MEESTIQTAKARDHRPTIRRRLDDYKAALQNDRTAWQALDTLNMYRIFSVVLYGLIFFTPLMEDSMDPGHRNVCQIVTLLMAFVAPALFLFARSKPSRVPVQASIGLILDTVAALVIIRSTGGVSSGLGILLVGPMILSAVIFPLRYSLLFAAAGASAVLWQSVLGVFNQVETASNIAPAGLLGATYFVCVVVGFALARRTREGHELAQQRGVQLADLARVNEMVIDRMRTGVMLIDTRRQTHLLNDAAWYLAGMPDQRSGSFAEIAGDIEPDYDYWLDHATHMNQPRQLARGVPEIVPRFARLNSRENSEILVFLEDTSIISRRAQEMTLASMGKLSASIAHEIRNPLAAIKHSAQLLGESTNLDQPDQNLTNIIVRHCGRMNDIIENVLQLSRRESSHPEAINLGSWLTAFLDEFLQYHEIGEAAIELHGTDRDVWARVDPGQLQQVVWNLVQNALRYGRSPDASAKIVLDWSAGNDDEAPWLEVVDFGPGIPETSRSRVFEPFFTVGEHGTGLGLYLCQQLIQANQGTIAYEFDQRGSRFHIELPLAAPNETAGLPLESSAVNKANS